MKRKTGPGGIQRPCMFIKQFVAAVRRFYRQLSQFPLQPSLLPLEQEPSRRMEA